MLRYIKGCYISYKTKCMVISRGGKRANIKIRQDKIQQVELFKYVGSLIIEDMSCTPEIRPRIAIATEAFNGKKRLLCGKINKNLRKRLAKCYV